MARAFCFLQIRGTPATTGVDLVFVPGTTSNPLSTYNITGKVSGSAAKVTLSGAASSLTNTDSSGNYTFPGLQNGSYVVASSRSGYTFTPSTASVLINGASKAGVNFTATAVLAPDNVYRANVSGGPYLKLNADRAKSLKGFRISTAS